MYITQYEKKQINILSKIFVLLKEFHRNRKTHLIMAGDFDIFFYSKLDAHGRNPTLKVH